MMKWIIFCLCVCVLIGWRHALCYEHLRHQKVMCHTKYIMNFVHSIIIWNVVQMTEMFSNEKPNYRFDQIIVISTEGVYVQYRLNSYFIDDWSKAIRQMICISSLWMILVNCESCISNTFYQLQFLRNVEKESNKNYHKLEKEDQFEIMNKKTT